MTRIVLASGSATRAAMLHRAGVVFTVDPAAVDEGEIKDVLRDEGASAADTAEALAELKALRRSGPEDQSLVIGADQMLSCDGVWYDKPADRASAAAQLLALAGRTHQLDTAVVVARAGGAIWRDRAVARLTMRPLTPDYVGWYLDQVGATALTSVGGYQLEGLGAQLFTRVDGDYFGILGLPLLPLLDLLRRYRALPT
jgi:septum formation protein